MGDFVLDQARRRAGSGRARVPTEPRKGTPTQIAEQPLLHRAHVTAFEEDGATWFRLATEIAADGNMLAIDAIVRDETDLPWARRVLATVKR